MLCETKRYKNILRLSSRYISDRIEVANKQPIRTKSLTALLLDDGKRALSWAEDNTLRLWDLRSRRENALFIGDDPVRCCIVSRTEQTAVVGDSRGRVLIFDLPATRGKGNKFKAPDQLRDSTHAERRAAMTWAQRLKRVFMR